MCEKKRTASVMRLINGRILSAGLGAAHERSEGSQIFVTVQLILSGVSL